jgi:hypothetical protein
VPETRSPPPARDKIVAVGLLTQRDIEVLGIGLCRLFRWSGTRPLKNC